MTTVYEKDYEAIKQGHGEQVIEKRKLELYYIKRLGMETKNSFKAQCAAQDYKKKQDELYKLEELFEEIDE
ncbi:MAG: hypothetical protein ACI4CX_01860 [Candidatus Weimeria sp.]